MRQINELSLLWSIGRKICGRTKKRENQKEFSSLRKSKFSGFFLKLFTNIKYTLVTPEPSWGCSNLPTRRKLAVSLQMSILDGTCGRLEQTENQKLFTALRNSIPNPGA